MSQFDLTKVLTTGCSGMLGAYIDFGLRPTKEELDVLHADQVMDFVKKHQPQAIIHLAAATDTTECERDPAYAYTLNGMGTLNVALAAQAVGAVMVYVSTSRVFSGDKQAPYTETDEPNPISVYGKSKRLGEVITALVAPEHLIVRTSWVFGGGRVRDNKFYGSVLKKLYGGEKELVALHDVLGSPTYAKDLIVTITEMLENKSRGIVHVGNGTAATRADIARSMVAHVGLTTPVRAVGREYFETGHLLPANESISSERVQLRPWQDALGEYIDTEWEASSGPQHNS
jgi:dTDP-4-dehydrorhamnose reductase